MATEIDIPVSVSSKKGDREDDALSSEFLEEKVTEHPGNKVKQLESRTNQSLETSSHVAETVNTQLETDTRTAEGGNFFQALSVPMVTADEHSNTPESCKATTTEDQEERKKSKIEGFTEGKPNDDERVEVIASKEASENELQPKTEDHDIVEAISAQNKGSFGLVKGSDKDIEGVTEFCNKDERMSGSSDAKAEAGKEEDLQGTYSEGKEPESVKTKENIEEDTEEIRPSVETDEKTEYKGLQDGIATDVCVSTQTKPEGTTEDEEKKDEKAIESDNGQMKKLGRPLVKEACEETGLEKGESEEGLELLDSMAPSKKELASNDEDQEKEQVLNIFGKDQDYGDDFTGSQYATCDDIKETTGQHATTVDYFKEQDLNETPGEILKEETEEKSVDAKEGSEQHENGARDEREQKPMESVNEIVNSCSEIEQQEQIEEIRPSVEIEEEMEQKGLLHAITTDACISTQTKSQVETPEREEKDEEEATESDGGQKEKSDNPSMKEVCEETAPKKVESEKEKAISVLHKDEDQEKEQEVNMSEKDQGEDNITSSQNATFEGGLQKKNQHSESNEPELVIEEDTEEIRSGVKTLEKTEQQRLIHAIPTAVCISTQTGPEGTTENKEKNDEEAIGSDDGQTKKSGSPTVKKVCEEVVPEKAESEEVLKFSDNSSMALNENEIVSKDEDQEKEQEIYVSGKGQGGGVDVTSSQNASSEDIQETTISQHATTLAYFEEVQDLNTMPKYILKEEAEDKTINPQEASEQCENEAKDKKEQKPEESVNKIVHSCSEIEQEEDTEEIKPSVETKEKSEQQELLHAITTDACISTQTNSHVESAEHEENNEETIDSDDGQKEKSDNLSVREICEEMGSEKVESEGVKLSDNFSMKQNEKTTARLNKDEDQEMEHELSVSEKDQGEDDVTYSQDSASVENLQAKNYDDEGREPKFVTTRESIEEVTEETISSMERKENVEQQGLLHAITTDACISTQTESQVGTKEHEEKNGEEVIESDEGQKENSESSLVKDVCEDTASEKVEYDEVKHSNSSSMKLDEKAITSNDEDQESEQKVNMSEKDQVEDDITSLHDTTFEGGLQEKKHHSEGNEPEVVKTKESLAEDTEEIIYSVESIEKTEEQRLMHAITTDVCLSAQTEPEEETTEENEEKIEEDAIESDDGQTTEPGSPVVKEVCDETVSEKADGSEEGLKHSDSSSMALNENELASKDEYREKEQELDMLEKSQDGGDDVTSSQNASNEDIKEMIDQHATKVAYFEEVQGLNALPKDILKEEVKDRTTDPREASEQCENRAKDRREQETEDGVNKPIHSHSEIIGENIKEDDADAGNNKEEVSFEKLKYEAGEAGDGTECETAGGTQKISPENKDDATADDSKSTEEILHDVEMSYDKAGSPLAEETEDEKFKKKENWYMDLETHMQKGDVTKKVDEEHFYATYEQKSIDELEQEKSIPGELQARVEKELQEDTRSHQERIPALEDAATLEPQVNLPYLESTYPSESEKSPMQALESVYEVQTPEVVAYSKDSKVKEECIDLATAEYTDENNVEEEQKIKINELSSAEKKEQAMESKQVAEHPSISYLGAVPIEEEVGRSSEHENTTDEGRSVTDPYQDSVADKTIGESCPPATEEENVKQAPTKSDEAKRSDPNTEEKALTKENLELHGEVKPTSELMIEEDQVNEAKPQPEQSDITSENISKCQTLEFKLERTSEKDLILTDKVAVETEKEKGRNEVKVQVSEEDSCPTELEKTSKSNQKELANEVQYLKSIPVGNTEVTEVKAESQIEVENKQAAEDLSCLSKASPTIGASKIEMSDGTGQTVTIIGEVKDDSVDEASKYERIPVLEDAEALELQVDLPEIESINTPPDGQDGMKLREGMPWSTQETIEQKGVLISQLTDREILEGATENRKEASNHELEKKEKDDELISEIQTPEAILKMEMKEEHLEAINNSCETLLGGLSSEKSLDEIKEIDAKEDIEVIVRQEEKAIEDSYQDAVAEVTEHERLSQTEEKLVSMVPPEELTSPRAEDQTYELVLETDKTKVEHSSISKEDRIPELMEEKVTNKISEDQRSIKERYIEEEGQDNFGVENKEARSVNVVVDDVIVNEVLLEVEKSKESKSLNDNINEEASCVHNPLTSATDELCQIKRLNSSPNELLEAKGSVEDTEDPKLMDENLDLKAENFPVMKGPYEDKKQNVEKTNEIVASEFERLENMVTEEKMIEADATKERETLEEPQADDPAKTTSDSTRSSTEQDKEVRSEESSGHGDVHKLEEKPTEVFEITSELVEIVAEGREASAILTENVQEASPKMFLVKHDPEITTTVEKIEDEIKDKDETLVNVHLFTSTKEVACLSNEKTGKIQVSTLNSEIDEGKHNGLGDMLNKEREAVQTQEHISNIKFVDPPSDVEIREQRELMHCGLQDPSEDNALLSQNDKKIADSLILPSAEKEIIQGVDKRFEEAPAIDFQKHEKGLDNKTKARIVDVVSNAECSEIEQHLDTKEATSESINQEYQSEQKKEADESIEREIPIQKVSEQTIEHKEIANEFLVMSVAKEEEKRNNLQDHSKEQEYSGESTYQDLEAVKEPFQIEKLSDKVDKAGPIDIQEETIAEGNLHKEETEERTNITEATVNLHHREKSDETKCKGTSTEAAIPVEYVKISDVELECDMDAPVPKCASTRNPEVRSADLEGPSIMNATADKAGYNKDPSDKTTEVHVAEKGVLKEDVHLESTCDKSKTTEKVSGMNQEPFNLPLTTERSMELDAPVMHATAATEDMQISQKCATDDLIKISQIQPEKEKYKISACTEDKQLPNKPHQNESMESKHLPGNINASHEEGEPTAKSLNAEAEDLKATNASGTKPQCSSEVVKEGKKISDEKEKSETPEPATILFTDILHESTQGKSEVAENLIEEREPALTKDQQVDKEEMGDSGAKTDGENEEEEDDEDNQKMGSCSDALVMVEASKDMEVKVHKKSHNILSGVGSKVKHSIAKVKKAITGKSSHPKPPSPKGRD